MSAIQPGTRVRIDTPNISIYGTVTAAPEADGDGWVITVAPGSNNPATWETDLEETWWQQHGFED